MTLATTPLALRVAAIVAGGYLLGGVSTALIIGKLVKGIDLREVGSGNLGATNVARNLGGTWAVVVFALDFSKAAFAAWVGGMIAPAAMRDAFQFAGGVAAIVGHVYSPYLRFRGGKGIAATAGAALVIIPWVLLGGAISFFVVAISTRRVSVGSLTIAAVAVPLTLWLDPQPWRIAYAVGVALLIVWSHRPNIRRLLKGEEPKVSWGIFKDDAPAAAAGAPPASGASEASGAGGDVPAEGANGAAGD